MAKVCKWYGEDGRTLDQFDQQNQQNPKKYESSQPSQNVMADEHTFKQDRIYLLYKGNGETIGKGKKPRN